MKLLVASIVWAAVVMAAAAIVLGWGPGLVGVVVALLVMHVVQERRHARELEAQRDRVTRAAERARRAGIGR